MQDYGDTDASQPDKPDQQRRHACGHQVWPGPSDPQPKGHGHHAQHSRQRNTQPGKIHQPHVSGRTRWPGGQLDHGQDDADQGKDSCRRRGPHREQSPRWSAPRPRRLTRWLEAPIICRHRTPRRDQAATGRVRGCQCPALTRTAVPDTAATATGHTKTRPSRRVGLGPAGGRGAASAGEQPGRRLRRAPSGLAAEPRPPDHGGALGFEPCTVAAGPSMAFRPGLPGGWPSRRVATAPTARRAPGNPGALFRSQQPRSTSWSS